MSDPHPQTVAIDQIPEPAPAPHGRFSLVWLMPLFALMIAGFVLFQNFANQGPVITVQFPQVAGVEVGNTTLRFRDVTVGVVEATRFAPGLRSVEVDIRLDKDIAPYVDEGASFWLVEPQVTARGVTGLDTVLSGVYIAGNWDGDAGTLQYRFEARDIPPLIRFGDEGTRIVLRTASGNQMTAGAPVLFNGVTVGRLGDPVLSETGAQVTFDAFIEAPHDARLSTATRFWNSSGISLDINTGGVSVNVESLAALVEGGVSFGTLVTGGRAIGPGHVFEVFDSERLARSNVIDGDGAAFPMSVLLDDGVTGLVTGAAVQFQGIQVGQVVAMTAFANPDDPTGNIRLLADLDLRATRMGLQSDEDVVAQLDELVAQGLRARAASSGFLGQTVILELVMVDDAVPAQIITDTTTHPLLPSIDAVLSDPSESIDGLIGRVGSLPIEQLMQSAIDTLDSINAITTSADAQSIPRNANQLLEEARGLIGEDTQQALTDLQTAAANLRTVSEALNSDSITSAMAALDRSDAISADIATFAQGLPALSAQLQSVITTLSELPLSDMGTTANSAIGSLDQLLSTEAAGSLLPNINAVAEGLNQLVIEFDEAGLIESYGAVGTEAELLLEELDASNAALQVILSDVGALTETLPQVQVDALADSLDQLMQRLSAVLAAPGIDDIPAELAQTLAELRSLSQELRTGGAVANLNAALDTANGTLTTINTAAEQVPGLVSRLNAMATSLDSTISDYSSNSRLYGEMRSAVAEISRAAESIRSLARAIERNPNSLITGR